VLFRSWNVIHDPAEGLFKCWYEDWDIRDLPNARTWKNAADGKICIAFYSTTPSRTCYAQSKDGLNWEKPQLDYVKENGAGTNVVLGNKEMGLSHCPYVFLDKAESDPLRRFKVLFENRRVEGGNDMAGEGSFCVASSPDGIHWDVWDEAIRYGACGDILGDVITISSDPETGIYWANNRHPGMCSLAVQDRRKPTQSSWLPGRDIQNPHAENRRRIFRSESRDLCNWSTPRLLLAPDPACDNIDDCFYGMEQFQIGDDWIGFINVFHMTDNTMDIQLAHSRDGRSFNRVRPGQAWLQPTGGDAWDRFMVSICSKPILVGDELFIYHGGTNCHHDWWLAGPFEDIDSPEAKDHNMAATCLGLTKIKKDRFVSISSGDVREGLLITPPVKTSGRKLIINGLTRNNGAIRVAVTDGQNNVFEGFDADNCIPLSGDSVSHEIKWKNQDRLPEAAFIKFQFYLKNADLFSFEIGAGWVIRVSQSHHPGSGGNFAQ